MTKEELKDTLTPSFSSATFEDGSEWTVIRIEPTALLQTMESLKKDPFHFDYLFCLTCIDYKTHLDLVYHLRSTISNDTLVVKAKLDRENPEIETVCHMFRTAEFHEREAYDLMGVKFINHPDLRRLFLTDDWKGWPLRKDYEDPINMIKL
jgi:NADH/F420H2 dehydrogenase subunit C